MVAVGLTLVEPLANVDEKVPGVMAMLAAPATIQLSVLLVPEVMLVGFAVKEAMVGAEPLVVDEVVTPQPVSPKHINRIRGPSAPCPRPGELSRQSLVGA